MYKHFDCHETGIEVYKCDADRKNLNTRGRDKNVTIFTGKRYITEITKGFEARTDVDFQGQKWSRVFKMMLYPIDLMTFKHGMKVRLNMTQMYKNTAFNPALTPFQYHLNAKDVWDLEIHEIKTLYDGCETYGVAHLISYN